MTIKKKSHKKRIASVIALMVCFYVLMLFVRNASTSLLFLDKSRVNILFYHSNPVVLSLCADEGVSYIVPFSNEMKMYVPGGYNVYKVGSLGKLSRLKGDDGLLQRAFSLGIGAYVDYYFEDREEGEIFYSNTQDPASFVKHNALRVVLSPSVLSNGRILDRLYVAWLLIRARSSDVVTLNTNSISVDDEGVYQNQNFMRTYQGFFYEKRYRDSQIEVKIVYNTSYRGALHVTSVLEGQGIRIVDVDNQNRVGVECELIVDPRLFSKGDVVEEGGERVKQSKKAVSFMQNVFGCEYHEGKVEDADVILILNNKLEMEWK